MACCAAAAFFISQIVLAFESVRRRLFGARVRDVERNDAVAWTLGAPAAPRAARPSRARQLIFGALVAEALLIAGSAAAWTAHTTPSPLNEQTLWSLAMNSICTSGSPQASGSPEASGSPDDSRQRLTNWIEGNEP